MDLAAAFLLSLLGGYCFAYVWRVTAFTTKRIEGHHLSTLSRGRAAQLGLPFDWSSQFELTIRADEIVTAALFSAAIYAEFNPGWKQHSLQ